VSRSILAPRRIKFHITPCPEGFRASCPAFPTYSRWGATEEEAAWELEKVMLEFLLAACARIPE
jgi:hypothetical protein